MNIKWLIDIGRDDGKIDQLVASIEASFRAAGLVAPQEIVVDCTGIGAQLFDVLKHRGLPVAKAGRGFYPSPKRFMFASCAGRGMLPRQPCRSG